MPTLLQIFQQNLQKIDSRLAGALIHAYDVIEMCAPAAPPIRLRIRTRTRTRTLTLNPNPNPRTHPNPNPIFNRNRNKVFERKQNRTKMTPEYRST